MMAAVVLQLEIVELENVFGDLVNVSMLAQYLLCHMVYFSFVSRMLLL